MLLVMVTLVVQWSRDDSREAARKDRQAERDDDAELKAYNAMLEQMRRGRVSVAEQPLDLELLGTVVAEYQVEARVGAVRIAGERLSVDLVLDQPWEEDVEELARTHVRIDADGVLGWELAGTPGPDVTHVEVHDEHPALRLHTEISDSVYVRGARGGPELLAYRLRVLVESETGGWYPPVECFHRLDDLPAHLAGGRGLLARGRAASSTASPGCSPRPGSPRTWCPAVIPGAGTSPTAARRPGSSTSARRATSSPPRSPHKGSCRCNPCSDQRPRSGRPVCHAGRSDGYPAAPRRRLTA